MDMAFLKLPQMKPIAVLDNKKKAWGTLPSSPVFGNISTLWIILEQIVNDWKSEANKYPKSVASKPGKELLEFHDAFETIKPFYIRCLFSYVVFFFMLENGYNYVYSQLNWMNKKLCLNLPHGKLPSRPDFVRTLWRIRNFSVAHWADTEKRQCIDALEGRDFGIFCALESGQYELAQLQFGLTGATRDDEASGKTERSKDRRTKPLLETHTLCSNYLKELDGVCSDYLSDIKARLPTSLDACQYYNP
jgi:hypothetical protein